MGGDHEWGGWWQALGFAALVFCGCGDDGNPAAGGESSSTTSSVGSTSSGSDAPTSAADVTTGSTSSATTLAESSSGSGDEDSSGGPSETTDADTDSSSSSGPAVCAEGEAVECYEGPRGSLGIGQCQSGLAICTADDVPGECRGWVGPAFDGCHTNVDEDCDGASAACVGDQIWQRMVGSVGQDPGGRAVFGPDGDIYLASYSSVHTYFEPVLGMEVYGGRVHYAHYDADGGLVAATSIGGSRVRDFAVDGAGNAYVVGHFDEPTEFGSDVGPDSGVFLVKLDPSGVILWDRQFAGEHGIFDTSLDQIVRDPSTDTFLVRGVYSGGTFDLGLGALPDVQSGAFLSRFDADGNAMGIDVGYSAVGDIAVSHEGRVALFGTARVFSGLTLAGTDVALPDNDNYYLALLDGTGQLETVVVGEASSQYGEISGSFAPDGTIWMVADRAASVPGYDSPFGESFGPGAFVAHYDGDGGYLAHRELFGAAEPRDVSVGPGGLPVVVGEFEVGADLGWGPIADERGVFIAKYLPDLEPTWVRLGTTTTIWALHLDFVDVDASDRVLASGPNGGNSALNFGEGPSDGLSSANDTFLSVFSP